ncbi:hypothetical protein C5S53_15415 [Methanophagales archaeon]|nr:hypothetical protein C5S53_15415 [Methanophagales archaeon]
MLKIWTDLSSYCQEHKVISEGELALKISECVSALSDADRDELASKLGGDPEEMIFKSITSEEKLSVFSPDMHTRINYQGEIFYCLPTHGYMSEELAAAFLRWTKLRSPTNALKSVVISFLKRSEYQVNEGKSEGEHLELMAVKNDDEHRTIHIFVLPSITFVPHFVDGRHLEWSESGEEVVIVVPTEKTPAPFISFFRGHDVSDAMIWVADVGKNTIDPFIGIPSDEAIENNFANPRQARRAVSIWMQNMHFI